MTTATREINKAELHGYTVTLYRNEDVYTLKLIEPLYTSEMTFKTIEEGYNKFLEVLDWLESKPC